MKFLIDWMRMRISVWAPIMHDDAIASSEAWEPCTRKDAMAMALLTRLCPNPCSSCSSCSSSSSRSVSRFPLSQKKMKFIRVCMYSFFYNSLFEALSVWVHKVNVCVHVFVFLGGFWIFGFGLVLQQQGLHHGCAEEEQQEERMCECWKYASKTFVILQQWSQCA